MTLLLLKAQRLQFLLKEFEQNNQDPFLKHAIAMEYLEDEPGKAWTFLKDLVENHEDYLPAYYVTSRFLQDSGYLEEAGSLAAKGIELAKQKQDTKALEELTRLQAGISD